MSAFDSALSKISSTARNLTSGHLGTPIPQVGRPVALTLFDGGFIWTHVFFMRPEEITYTKPTKAAVLHTLGGAWVDDFGEGVHEIVMQGHTGWRGNMFVPGELMFYNIRDLIIKEFHKRRAEKAKKNEDIDTVELLLLDTLNMASYKVYPVSFQLRRNKQRPLLYQYNIRLIALDSF